ncbi:MAG TPA: CocE/NonD family hydrolase [Blastocatellia bacterium]|nr:CocE/NonD family hydrolase [Blastocatellia bacterium]
MLKRHLWLLLLAFVAISGSQPLNAQSGFAAAPESFLSPSAAFNGQSVQVPMRDGKALAADVYLPKSGGKHPVVLVQTPYNKSLMRPAFEGKGRFGAQSIFTDSSYAFVITDWRGKFASLSAQTPGAQPNLAEDGFDTVAWIARQEWSNGKVATWGPSALGRAQYETARSNPPNLVCAVPLVMALNLDYDVYFPGGAMWEEFPAMLGRIGFGTNIFDLLASRPVKDDFWQKVSPQNYVKGPDLRVPMLFIGGWYDIYTDQVIAAFQTAHSSGGEKARIHSRLIVGPWVHMTDQVKNGQLEYPNAQGYGMKKAMAFIDYWAKATPNNFADQQPRISYYQMGENEWRSTEVWPPKGSRERDYHLQADRSLSTKAPPADSKAASFSYDPASPTPTLGGHVLDSSLAPGPADQREKVESRSDVLVFTTPALEKDLAVAGKIKLKLFVSSDRTDTDFTAILTDVYPDGRSMLVTEGIRRMRFRNTTSKEELITPGQIYPITIDLTNTALTFLKGHRARVIISSSNHPRFALNLNDGGPMYKKGKGLVALNTVYADKKHPSALVLPVIEK